VLLAGCESNNGVTKFTKPPVVAIETPTDGASINEGVPVSLRGRVVDETYETSLTSITATWAVNGGTICEGAVFDTNGVSECSTVFTRGDAAITLTAINPDGESAVGTVHVTIEKNEAPTAEIVTPEFGGDYFANALTLFEGIVSDGEDLPESLTVSWESSRDGVLPFSSTPSSDGKTTGTTTLSEGEHQLTLTVTDTTGRTGSDTTTIQVAAGSRPSINLVSPKSGDRYNIGDTVYFEAEVSDAEDPPDNLVMSWESDIDGVFSTQGAGSDGTADFTYDRLSRGVHSITVTATDTDGITARDYATLYINEAPEAPTVSITPDPAGSGDALKVNIITPSYDADGDTVTYTYFWYLNGVDSGRTSNPLPASATTREDIWTVYVVPNDGAADGPAGTDSATIGNGPPSLTSATISPVTAYTNDTLTATGTGYSDPDGDPESETYQWYLNGTAIAGATDPTLSGSYFVKGDDITVDITPYDGFDYGAAVTSGTRTIQNSAPSAPGVDVTPNYPEPDDDLTCSVARASTDDDGDAISYTYSWTVNGVPSAHTTATISSAYTSDGETWACSVTASDGTASSAAGSDSVLVGDYTPPDAPVLNSLDAYRNETSATVNGSTEAFATVTLYISSSTGTTTDTGTANGAGTFSFSESLTAGLSYSFYATATDADGNTSAVSNVVGTEVCDPVDDYEDTTSYGDSCADPVVDWSTLDDSGTSTIEFNGNILNSSDDDWYYIGTSNTITSSYNNYRFHVELTAGSSEYGFVVYEGGCTTADLECGTGSGTDPEGNGYTEYEVYQEDVGDGSHGIPSDYRTCASGSKYNECTDLSSDYYIHVFRTTTSYSCQEYSLKITNGVW
jgi:hypothetical protein